MIINLYYQILLNYCSQHIGAVIPQAKISYGHWYRGIASDFDLWDCHLIEGSHSAISLIIV